jgi:hypothetical protein
MEHARYAVSDIPRRKILELGVKSQNVEVDCGQPHVRIRAINVGGTRARTM